MEQYQQDLTGPPQPVTSPRSPSAVAIAQRNIQMIMGSFQNW